MARRPMPSEYPAIDGHMREAFKKLASNIRFSSIDSPIKTILVTSSLQSEGKSFVSLNLAHTFAELGMNTVLIESDLRRPVLRRVTAEKKRPGFVNYLAGQVSFEEIGVVQAKNLTFIDCGAMPPDAVEILNSQSYEMLLQRLRNTYDIVIIDSPPLNIFIDAAVISSRTDGTLLVVDAGSIDYKMAQDSVEQLRKANAHILGVVLNNTDTEQSDYYYYYDYSYGQSQDEFVSRSKRKKRKSHSDDDDRDTGL